MTCREVAELLIDFVGGDLPPEVLAHLRQHLAKCPPCVAYIDTYQITIKLTRHLPDAPMPEALMERLKSALQEMKDA